MKTKKNWLGVACAATLVAVGGVTLVQNPAGATFPGDNGKIVFDVYSSGEPSTDYILTVGPDGGSVSQLAGDTTELPAWSADGSKIAYADYSDGSADIWVMNADGSDAHQVTHCSCEDDCYSATWSPDGSKIAYINDGSPNDQIWVVNADGTDPHAITSNAVEHVDPQWSPDGTKIAYVDYGQTPQIAVMNADGTDPVVLTSGSYASWYPDWSPDGSKIALSREDETGAQIMIMNADGSDLVAVTDASNGPDNEEPVWSPDGTKIAYVAWPDYESEVSNLWSIDVDGTNARQLTNNDTAEIYSPDWQAIPHVTPPSSSSTSSTTSTTTSTSVAPTTSQEPSTSESPTTTTGPAPKPTAPPAVPVERKPTYTG